MEKTIIKKFKPSVRRAPNGKYKVNCTIMPAGSSQSKGKIVMGEILNLTEVKLMFPIKLGDDWKPIQYKGNTWYFKIEQISNLTFYN